MAYQLEGGNRGHQRGRAHQGFALHTCLHLPEPAAEPERRSTGSWVTAGGLLSGAYHHYHEATNPEVNLPLGCAGPPEQLPHHPRHPGLCHQCTRGVSCDGGGRLGQLAGEGASFGATHLSPTSHLCYNMFA
jgi:hypothetical protein